MSTRKLCKLLSELEALNGSGRLKDRVQLAQALEKLLGSDEGLGRSVDGDLLLRVASALAAVQREAIEALKRST
jgi:hypothetical protein